MEWQGDSGLLGHSLGQDLRWKGDGNSIAHPSPLSTFSIVKFNSLNHDITLFVRAFFVHVVDN
jgi:hypothetical protein